MGAEDMTGFVHEGAGGVVLSRIPADESGVVPVGDEADVLTFLFLGIDKALLRGDLTDLILGQPPQGEQAVGQLILIQGPEYIALVLFPVGGPL